MKIERIGEFLMTPYGRYWVRLHADDRGIRMGKEGEISLSHFFRIAVSPSSMLVRVNWDSPRKQPLVIYTTED